jgi:hypothetical protein
VQTVFLSFRHTLVAGQETCSPQYWSGFRVDFGQCPGYSQLYGTGLASDTTAMDIAEHIESGCHFGEFQGLQHNESAGTVGKEIFKGAFIYNDIAFPGY